VETNDSFPTSPTRGRFRRRLAAVVAVGAIGGLALTSVAVMQANATAAPGSGCAKVAVITARASGEAAGEGITGSLVTQIVNTSTQTVSRASVTYPATLTNYASSSAQGESALKTQLTNEVNACPTTKVVLLGYSQGAQVVEDMFSGGGGGLLGATTAPLATSITSHVAAVATFGDPRHVTGVAVDLGTARTNGLFPRSASQDSALAAASSKIQAYCDANDEFCASGASLQVHLTYLNRYQNAAASFVLGKVGG
jgi:acetylxylan esterase